MSVLSRTKNQYYYRPQSICLSLFIYLSTDLSIYLPTCQAVCLSVCLYLSIHPSTYLPPLKGSVPVPNIDPDTDKWLVFEPRHSHPGDAVIGWVAPCSARCRVKGLRGFLGLGFRGFSLPTLPNSLKYFLYTVSPKSVLYYLHTKSLGVEGGRGFRACRTAKNEVKAA